MELGDAVSLVTLVALVYAVVNVLRNLFNLSAEGSKNQLVTQVTVWVAAVVVLLLAGQAEIAENVVIFGNELGDMDVASLILAGLCIGSTSSVVNDFFAARDNSRTSVNPPLIH
jgi:hypothetical protein